VNLNAVPQQSTSSGEHTDPEAPTVSARAAIPAGDTEPGGLLDRLAAASGSSEWQQPRLPTIQRKFYTAGFELARGGMGRILTAHDRRVGRRVALKELLTRDPTARARFEREARITALLQHPAIVPVYEVGVWENGEPFYAMKEVDGVSLEELIRRASDVAARLALVPNVLAVADALAYAHSRGVIHRDVKPTNILVGAFGETVVIDWGIAKHVHDTDNSELERTSVAGSDQALTLAGHTVGTPAYMPLEQAMGQADERSDVYALGATLYHVLTGRRPYVGAFTGTDLLAKLVVCSPKPAATLVPEVPPDLLAIVAKAMARDPAERYATASDLASDLRRFVSGNLVAVHRYTAWQLLSRWLRRHRTAVIVAAAAVLLLVAVVTGSVLRILGEQRHAEQRSAEAERLRADAEQLRGVADRSRADAEQLMDFMLGDLKEKLTPIGKIELLDTVARKASEYYQRRPSALGREDQHRRVKALHNLGDVLRAKGDTAAALAAQRSAVALAEALVSAQPGQPKWERDLSISLNRVGVLERTQGDLSAALASFRAAQTIAERRVARDPSDTTWQRDLSVSYDRIGDVLRAQHQKPEALAAFRSALAISEKVAARDPNNPTWQRDLAVRYNNVGDALLSQSNHDAALSSYRASLVIGEQLVARFPSDANLQRDLSICHERLGDVYRSQKDFAAAQSEFRVALAMFKKLAASDAQNLGWQRDVTVLQRKLGAVLLASGDAQAAHGVFAAALAINERLATADPSNKTWQRDVAESQEKIADSFAAQRKPARARAGYLIALEITERLLRHDATNARWNAGAAQIRQKLDTCCRGKE
jgi:tetratricopeptide (TPR) repeat protein